QQNASKKVEGLFYAGATTAPGVGVPMCLISAELVLKRIRGDSSPGPLPIDDGLSETAVSQPSNGSSSSAL
ncbi:MAG: phytoene desaturase, partial [Microbacterium gubbeenense]